MIFPESQGKLNGHTVRVPLLNRSLTDAVVELEKEATQEVVNHVFKEISEGELKGILGYEEKPLISIDYVNDSRSSMIDALSIMVVNETQLKVYTRYDNERGYSCRMTDHDCHVINHDKD